jgi:U2 small nuclear ribonucleoprotein B''
MQHIHYAKSKSYATHRVEDPTFVPPSTANASSLSTKRQRDGDVVGDRPKKREKADGSDEEMEIDEDDEKQDTSTSYRHLKACASWYTILSAAAPTSVPSPDYQPTPRLLCQNLPQEVTDDVLSVLFQQ